MAFRFLSRVLADHSSGQLGHVTGKDKLSFYKRAKKTYLSFTKGQIYLILTR